MKKIVLLLAMVGFLFFTTNLFAYDLSCPPGQEGHWEGLHWKCVDVEEPSGGGDIDINIDNENRNTNTNINTNINSNNNKNTNVNLNGNKNTNINGASAVNSGNNQTLIYKEAKNPVNYDHISPDLGKTSAELIDHSGESDIRTLTSIFDYDDDDLITIDEAKSASSGADIDVTKAILWESDTQLKELNWKVTSGKYMGSLTLITDSATLDQVIARACKEAMLLGATSISFVVRDAKKVSATKYGVDFGSSASVAAKADGSIVIAPGATLGWSKAVASNIVVGEVYVVLFRDDSLIVK